MDAASGQRGARRRWADRWSLLALAVAVLAVATAGGCGTLVVAPAQVEEPVTVYLLDHGRTPSLVMPGEEGGYVRYAYGDWRWYALGETTFVRALAALLWPTSAGLGRGELDGPPTDPDVRAGLPGVDRLHAIAVEGWRARALRARLDALHAAGREHEVEGAGVGLRFVPHPRGYSACFNSNHAAAEWLRELGCATRGLSLVSSWRVRRRRAPTGRRDPGPCAPRAPRGSSPRACPAPGPPRGSRPGSRRPAARAGRRSGCRSSN